LLTAAVIQAAADLAPTDDPDCEGLMVWLLDGAPPDALFAGRLASLGKMLPHQVTRVTSHNAAEEMQRLSDILHSRGEGGHGGKATILIIGLEHSRLGVLRPSEDDFSFSNDDAGPKPDRQLADILQDGPVAGIHSLLWLDGLNNLNRGLSRASQREFDAKVLFQMGGNDSGQLIDSTAATDLGPGRALLFTEEFGSIEKFRPWAMPDDDWLAKAAAQIRGR
jgi:S-DNA-T family DNA segregation ATPase FtsK/SpoIIIE